MYLFSIILPRGYKMENGQPSDLIKTSEARKLLRISPIKMAALIKGGTITYYTNPLDRRVKLVSKAAVLSLQPKMAD
jgi:hypothetical protein